MELTAIETIEKIMEVTVIKKLEAPQAVGNIGEALHIQTVERIAEKIVEAPTVTKAP